MHFCANDDATKLAKGLRNALDKVSVSRLSAGVGAFRPIEASFNEVFYVRRRGQVKRSTMSRISVMSSIAKRTPSRLKPLSLTPP
jgi:hypothetical protein